MLKSFLLSMFIMLALAAQAQIPSKILDAKEKEKQALLEQLKALESEIVDLKHQSIIDQLKGLGLPSTDYIQHAAMIISYSEEHEQANWVAHMIIPDIKDGLEYRSNDFRIDPKVKTGTAIQEDYFLTDTLADGTVEYDGYGYDRGHLAPSADFRWSAQALSESYFYSNMSPQLPEFNREKWAELETHLRKYVIRENVPLVVYTAPVLKDDLKKIERATNHVSIPEQFVKVVYDPSNNRGIAFIMENKSLSYPLDNYVHTIDDAEALLGINLFSQTDESFESVITKTDWFANLEGGDKDPIYQPSLPPGHFNTVLADRKVGQEVIICGEVVASRYSRKGHLWFNLDRHFPNQLFSIFIKKEDIVNFDSEIKNYYLNEKVCIQGKVEKFTDCPSITLKDKRQIKLYN